MTFKIKEKVFIIQCHTRYCFAYETLLTIFPQM